MNTLERPQLLRRVADLVPTANGEDCVRVGIDGVDGSGKTVFAGELADALQVMGRRVVRISVDDFHNVSAVRYRRGRSSPEGFWLDSFNYERLHADVLEPLGPGGSRRYRSSAHDLASDLVLNPAQTVASAHQFFAVQEQPVDDKDRTWSELVSPTGYPLTRTSRGSAGSSCPGADQTARSRS